MGSWPGAEADKWWASLPPSRREQIHRWIHPAPPEPIPEHQLALHVDGGEPGAEQTLSPPAA